MNRKAARKKFKRKQLQHEKQVKEQNMIRVEGENEKKILKSLARIKHDITVMNIIHKITGCEINIARCSCMELGSLHSRLHSYRSGSQLTENCDLPSHSQIGCLFSPIIDEDSEDDENDDLCMTRRRIRANVPINEENQQEIRERVLELIEHLPLLEHKYRLQKNPTIKLILTQRHLRKYYNYLCTSYNVRNDEIYIYKLLSIYFKHIDNLRDELEENGMISTNDQNAIIGI
jgi:hypothetical protein